jgi:hypothetical protein
MGLASIFKIGTHVIVMLGCVLPVCGLWACGGRRSVHSSAAHYLNTARVALAIEQSILSQRGLHARVYCPAEVPQIKGQRFTCIASVSGVAPATFAVVQVDAQGHVQYASK